MEYRNIRIRELVDKIRCRELPVRAVITQTYEKIKSTQAKFNAFTQLTPLEEALRQADRIDGLLSDGIDPGPLAGVPIAIKDIEDVARMQTTFGSRLYQTHGVALRNSVGVERLCRAGGIVIGKTNTSEFACKAATDNPLFGTTRNPWNPRYTCGGSSGGSAVAVATGTVPLAIGSDGGGSLRIPAAVCGFTGFKPSTGVVPSGGETPPLCSPLITRGPMAFTAEDTLYALEVLAGSTATDLSSYDLPPETSVTYSSGGVPTFVMSWSAGLGFATVDDEIRSLCEGAIERLVDLGWKIKKKDDVFPFDPNLAWYTLWTAGLATRLRPFWGTEALTKTDGALQELVEDGRHVTGVEFCEALDASHKLNYALCTILAETPILLTPTYVGQVPTIEPGSMGTVNGAQSKNWVQTAAVFNMTRNPVVTVQIGFTKKGIPVGLQMCGPISADRWLLKIGAEVERSLGGPGLYESGACRGE